MSDPRREIVIKVAEANLEFPYRWGGSDPIAGRDCSGLVVHCYQSAGILKHGSDYSANGLYLKFKKGLEESGLTYIQKASPDPGDAVFWFSKSGKKATHVEIALDNRFVIGASGSGRPKFDVKKWLEIPTIFNFYDSLRSSEMEETFLRILNQILFKDQAEKDDAFVKIRPINYRGMTFTHLDPFII